MNFALSAGLSACARAPETISALTAAEIIKVLSIVGLMSSLFCQGKEAFLVQQQLASTRVRSVHWNPISPTRNNVAHLQPSADLLRHANNDCVPRGRR